LECDNFGPFSQKIIWTGYAPPFFLLPSGKNLPQKNSGLESFLKELLGGQLPIWLSTYTVQFETIGLTICLCAKPCTNTKKKIGCIFLFLGIRSPDYE
jgi:hypothetical protein